MHPRHTLSSMSPESVSKRPINTKIGSSLNLKSQWCHHCRYNFGLGNNLPLCTVTILLYQYNMKFDEGSDMRERSYTPAEIKGNQAWSHMHTPNLLSKIMLSPHVTRGGMPGSLD